ncbi:hypothetical protein MKI28_05510 [Streptococcus thermophilus]|uniref:hypothetical protein n=1 Tax=Streptococcus thermophilus TaxID=1308 RepID=UPI0024055247|nr:hypothetical protein [Streptococcus thermophilus]MDG0264545.1 hypothetical protein [Streptococcus thermophilus]
MDNNFIATLLLSVLGSSVFTLLLSSYVIDPMKDKRNYIFDEKKRVYDSIIIFSQIILFPRESKYSLGVGRYDIQKLSDEKNVENALNDLKMAIPKLMLISKNKKVIEKTQEFIYKKNEESFNELIKVLQKDLYN